MPSSFCMWSSSAAIIHSCWSLYWYSKWGARTDDAPKMKACLATWMMNSRHAKNGRRRLSRLSPSLRIATAANRANKWQLAPHKGKNTKNSRQSHHKAPAPWEPKHNFLEISGRDYPRSKWRSKDELSSTSPVIQPCLPLFATKHNSALTHWMEEKGEWEQWKIDVGRQDEEGVSPKGFWAWIIYWSSGIGLGVISKFGLCRVSTCIVAFADSSSSNSEQKLSVENFQAFIKQAGRTDDVNHVFLHPCLPISFLWYFHRRTMDSGLGRTISKWTLSTV